MQPTAIANNENDIKRHETDARVERAKSAAYFGTVLLAGWIVAALARSMYPGGGISNTSSLGGPAFGLWLCGMWATISVYRLLDAGKTQRSFKDWLRVGGMVIGAALIWGIVYSGQWLEQNG